MGPASCGDVYRACRSGASSIGIVDGYFEHRLSVWHKEIVFALSRGVRVYGAASIGALRAAELADYGMCGVGAVFDAYRAGTIEDDDEVALVHEPAERAFRPQSEALVNMRATLERAAAEGVIARETAADWIALAKERFYPERTYGALRRWVLESGGAVAHYERFERWLALHGPVDRKRLDAIAMLERMTHDLAVRAPRPSAPVFEFAHTDAWEALQTRIDQELDAARPDVWSEAVEHAFATLLAQLDGRELDQASVQRGSEDFRRARGLLTESQTLEWMARNKLDSVAFSELIYNDLLAFPYRDQVQRLATRALAHVRRRRQLR